MSLFRLLLRRTSAIATTTTTRLAVSQTLISHPTTGHSIIPLRTFAFSSAEEAAAERRRRKRRLRIEPPLHALRRDPSAPRPPPDPNAPRLPDSTSALVGPRLNLHNRVQSLIRAGDLDSASSLARQAVFSRTRPTVFTCNAIIAAMYRAKRYEDAAALFNFFFNQSNIVPNVVSYNFLIVTHCESGQVDEGLEVYRRIISNAPFGPSSVTYRHLTKGLVDAGRIGEGMDLLREMLSKGHGADSMVYGNMIKGFLDLGDLGKANELFDELKERCLVYDGVVNATFMDWFFNQGREKEAMESYRGLLDRQFRMTPATCNVLLECLLRHGREKDAWELFDTMLDNHTPPNFQAVNSDTFSIMVNECFKLGKFDEAVGAFRKVGVKTNSKPFSMDVAGYNNIIVRFAEHDMIEEAEKFFEELRSKSLSPDVTGYRTLIDAYLKEKRVDDALRMFHLMVDANLRVIPSYANRWLSELVENDKVHAASQLLTKLGEKDPKPDVATYEIVVKGLCNSGTFDQCKEIISQMMGYGVGVTPTLRQFIVDVFEKEGQKDEIEKLLDTRRQGFVSRSQPNGNAGVPRPNVFHGNASPRFPQSAVSSSSLNQFTGTIGNGGHTGSGQMENPKHPAANAPAGFSGSVGHGGQIGYAGPVDHYMGPSGNNENARNQGAYEPQGFNTQAVGYSRNQGAYESAGFSAQSGSTRYPEPVQHGGQWSQQSGHSENARYSQSVVSGQWSQQSGHSETARYSQSVVNGQWSQQSGHSENARYSQSVGNGQWSQQQQPGHLENTRYSQSVGNGQWSQQSGHLGDARYSQSVGNGQPGGHPEDARYSQSFGHGQAGYTGSFGTTNR